MSAHIPYIMTLDAQHVPSPYRDYSTVENLVQWPRGGLPTLDAQSNRFFLNELRFIIPEMVAFDHPDVTARNALPVDTRAGPGAHTIEFRQVTQVGRAKVVTDYGDDPPRTNVFAEAFSSKIRSLACQAVWSMQEIRDSAHANANGGNVQLDREETEGAREAILRLENDLAWNGSTKHGLVGLLNAPTIPATVAPDGASTDPEWDTKTAQEIVDDLNLLVNQVVENSNQVERPDTILLPVAQYHLAVNLNMGVGTDTTALQYFVNNSPYIASMANVIPINELSGAGATGQDIMIAYRKDASKVQMSVPFDVESFAPEVRGMTTAVMYHSRFGDVQVKKPISLNIITDI